MNMKHVSMRVLFLRRYVDTQDRNAAKYEQEFSRENVGYSWAVRCSVRTKVFVSASAALGHGVVLFLFREYL